jgi:molybdenum cofactor cytidylyltransferase
MGNPVGIVLLAAGASRRMGCLKQLLPIADEPAVRHCVRNILIAGINNIVVVLGHERWRVAAAVSDFPVCFAINNETNSDMARSVEIGFQSMPQHVSGVMVGLCDHPLVRPSTYRKLRNLHQKHPGNIFVPVYAGKGGHPSLFPRSLCQSVSSGKPLSHLLRKHAELVNRFHTGDPGVVYDMDTPRDYRKMVNLTKDISDGL